MSVESAADRLSLLDDFGVAVRIFPGGLPVDIRGIADSPTTEVQGIATEVDFHEPAPTLLVRTEDLNGLKAEEGITVLEGPIAAAYIVLELLAEDDGAFTRIGLGDA